MKTDGIKNREQIYKRKHFNKQDNIENILLFIYIFYFEIYSHFYSFEAEE